MMSRSAIAVACKRWLIPHLAAALLACHSLCAQIHININGKVVDQRGDPVPRASVIMLKDKKVTFSVFSDAAGRFEVNRTLTEGGHFEIQAGAWGMSGDIRLLDIPDIPVFLLDTLTLHLYRDHRFMPAVVVKAKPPTITTNGDTIVYDLKTYRSPDARKVEDLIRKIDGFAVSPDGKITYFGKSVAAVMVEGDDLTAENYALLVKNLSAGDVSKVDVIRNYQANPLLASVSKADDIALNLRLSKDRKEKPGGSLSVGGGTAGRFFGDLNLNAFKSKVKIMLFANSNNTASPPSLTLPLDDAGTSTGRETPDNERIVRHSMIPAPFEKPGYSRNNKDASVVNMLSWRVSQADRVSLILGTNEISDRFGSVGKMDVYLSDSDQWKVTNQAALRAKSHSVFGRLSFQHTRGLRKRSEFIADISTLQSGALYNEALQGSVNDTYIENERLHDLNMKLSMDHTYKAGTHTVLLWKTKLRLSSVHQLFIEETSRLNEPFDFDAGNWAFEQKSREPRTEFQSGLTAYHKKEKSESQFGLRINVRGHSFRSSIMVDSGNMVSLRTVKPEPVDARRTTLSGGASTTRLIGPRNKFVVGVLMGAGYQNGTQQDRAFYTYKILGSFERQISVFKTWYINAETNRSLPDQDLFYTGPVLSGNASILDGLQTPRSVSLHSAGFGYVSANLFKATSATFNVNAGFADHDVTSADMIAASFIRSSLLQAYHTSFFRVSGSHDQFIPWLRGKLAFRLNAGHTSGIGLINQQRSDRRSFNWTEEVSYRPVINRVGMELLARLYHVKDLLLFNENRLRTYFRQLTMLARGRIKFSKTVQFLAEYGYHQLISQDVFQSMDLSFFATIKKGVNLAIIGHNLANKSQIQSTFKNAYRITSSSFLVMPRYFLLRISLDL